MLLKKIQIITKQQGKTQIFGSEMNKNHPCKWYSLNIPEEPGMVDYTWILITLEAEPELPKAQGQPGLHSKFQASPSTERNCLNANN